MDDHEATHGADHGHGAHGPEVWETSIWPVIAALASITAALALIWMAKDESNGFAGPLAGAALVAAVASVGAWIWERVQRNREEAAGHDVHGVDPRFTQVVTFTIAPGQLDRARAPEGVIAAVESADLSAIRGYQDLRVTVAPSADGPSQALVETTWQGRDGLATYNASRENLLDIISQHEGEVVPGTVQAFDMEVIRDTKQHSYRFGLPAGLAVLGGLLVGGFAFGAGQTAFDEETVVADGGNGGPIEDPFAIEATDNAFDKNRLVAPPETEVTFTLTNAGANPHNLSFYESSGGAELATGEIISGGAAQVTFTTPALGEYYFQCDVHPDQMNGVLSVEAGAPGPGGPGPGGPAAPAEIIATDNKFDLGVLEATAGQEFSITLVNEGAVPHNIAFLTEAGGQPLAEESVGEIIPGGESIAVTFTPPEAGTFFFVCQVHPNDMTGEFIVR
jgi:plastocyanin